MDEKDVIQKLTQAGIKGAETPLRRDAIKRALMAKAAEKTRVKNPIFSKLVPSVALAFAFAAVTYFVVDNMNEGSKFNTRGGVWSTYTDSHEGGNSQVWPPESDSTKNDFVMSQPGYGGTGYAVRVTGTTGNALGLNYNYFGFVVRFDEKSQCPTCQGTDIKKYSGIRFKIKGTLPAGQLMFVLPHESNNCIRERLTCKSLTDYADYEEDITKHVTREWTTVMINFRLDLKQPFWVSGENKVDVDKVLENVHLFKWQYKNGNGKPVEIWIDDVELF